jgi:hypothetical protein
MIFVKFGCLGTLIQVSKNLHFEGLSGRDALEGSLRKVLIIGLFCNFFLRNVPDSDGTVVSFSSSFRHVSHS